LATKKKLRIRKKFVKSSKGHIMKSMVEIKSGYQKFQDILTEDDKQRYKQLAKGQSPEVFIISCADSRVEPNVIFQSDPGELFTVRNVANLIPPYCPDGKYHGTSAALEFAVTALKVSLILILGHTKCGGIRACMAHNPTTMPSDNGFIIPWVQIAAEARYHIVRTYPDLSEAEQASLLEEEAIRLSKRNLMGFPFVKQAVDAGTLDIAGAVFDLENATIKWIE
jgi:carbonic anhydrase